MEGCEVQRYTRIILNDQIITIRTDDEQKLISALTKDTKKSFQKAEFERIVSGIQLTRGTL